MTTFAMPTNIDLAAKSYATLVTVANPGELSPIEAAVIDLCNELYALTGGSLVDLASPEDARAMRRALLTLLERYDATNAEDHPNPRWAMPNQRALAMSALGEVDRAIELELDAIGHADTPKRLEISLGNLADRCLTAGRYDDAVVFALRAQEVSPGSVPVLLTAAQALAFAGHVDEADTVFGAFAADPAALRPGTELWAYLENEERLRDIVDVSPALRTLFARYDERSGEGASS